MELDYEDRRSIESRLNELKMFDGFTCAIELSFDYNSTMYMFELQTEWYSELNNILDELDLARIDVAIEEARAALEADPANAYLNAHLANTMQQKLLLLQQANALASSAS